MLFRPVYGPELGAVYNFVSQGTGPVSRQDIYWSFLPTHQDDKVTSTQNIDDALSFLVSAGLVKSNGRFHSPLITPVKSFRLLVLQQLQALATGEIEPSHKTDPLYFQLLDQLFIKPDVLYIADVHTEANKLRVVADVGGISQEKIRSWKRVMAFLGLGQRIAQGFQCRYAPDLLLEILDAWPEREGILQELFESHLALYMPFQTQAGELAQAVRHSLLYLSQQQVVVMRAYQDSSSKPYFGENRWRHIALPGDRL